MTAKEKAELLVSQYFVLITNLPVKETWIEIHKNDYDKSKQCAKIAVEEISTILVRGLRNDDLDVRYWNEVKKEIELL